MAIMEMDTPTRVLPDQLGEFEDRLHYAVGYTPAVDHPEWTSFLQAAGFELVERRQLTLDQQLPGAGIAGSYAALELRRVGHRGIDTLSEEDQTTYHRLVAHGAGAVEDLGILRIRSSRTLWLARRPL